MLDCYRTGGANSPETFVTAIAATLARYPDQVIYEVTDPRSGIPVQITWMPSVKEVFDMCERAMLPIRNRVEQEKRISEQFEQRKREDQARATRHSYEELKAKYGNDWGIAAPEAKRKSAEPAPTVEQLRHHYAHYGLAFQPKAKDDAA